MSARLWPPPQNVAVDVGTTAAESTPSIVVGPCGLPAEGYRIRIASGVEVEASDAAGARHAQSTIRQLAALHADRLPCGVIEDWPAIATRGVMLDVSRARVPTLETLTALFDRLAFLKINHVELYIEHTFAYAGHGDVWTDASPYTPDDLRSLDAHATGLGIELSANQNCLGHMERWLRHDRYRGLALSPDGFTAPWGAVMPPMTMDPSHPGSLALARDLLAQLLPTLRSSRAHVGLDEPWELPSERAVEWVDYLRALRAAPETSDHELLVWADVPSRHPELIGKVPDGVTLCEWGYEASHPFGERAATLAAAGVPFWLCPGTSSWNSIGGRWTNATQNIAASAAAAAAHGATGLLVTDWGDNGHLQHLTVSEPLIAWAAGCAWNPSACVVEDLPGVVDQWLVSDAAGTFGDALQAIGDAHRCVAPQFFNQSMLTAQLYRPSVRLGVSRPTRGLTDMDLARAGDELERGARLIEASTLHRPDADAVVDEARAAATMLQLLVDDGIARLAGDGSLASVDPSTRSMLAERLAAISDEHRRLWLQRARPGGLDESVAVLQRLASAYAAT